MIDMPTNELLERVHSFPGVYMFKVIGKGEDGFVARVVDATREALNMELDPPFTLRQTANGRHVAITLQPHVESSGQVLAVYRSLSNMTGLIMLC